VAVVRTRAALRIRQPGPATAEPVAKQPDPETEAAPGEGAASSLRTKGPSPELHPAIRGDGRGSAGVYGTTATNGGVPDVKIPQLSGDAGPFPGAEPDRVGEDLGRRGTGGIDVRLRRLDVLDSLSRCLTFQSTYTSSVWWWAKRRRRGCFTASL